jgi:anaerobic selenocysteine-containing dehydrogenase
MNHLGRALAEDELDPPIKALFVWNGNPAVTVPNAELIRRGLERDDLFTVVGEQFMTDTARYADVVFPAATQLEQLDVVPAWGHLYLGWNEPAIAPIGDSVPNSELWRRLAAAMGFTEPELFEDDATLIRAALRGVDIDELREQGFVRLDLPEVVAPYAAGAFATANRKARLFDPLAAEAPMPTYNVPDESLRGDADMRSRFPLALLTPKHHTRFLNSSYAHLPNHGGREDGPFVEIHPDDARARGISDGEPVDVWNARGRMTVPAKISERLRPGVVAVPFGWWGDDHGRQGTANSLTSDTLTDWGGGVAYSDTLVEVSPTQPVLA